MLTAPPTPPQILGIPRALQPWSLATEVVLLLSGIALIRQQSLKDQDSSFSPTKIIIPIIFSVYQERQESSRRLCGKATVTKDCTKDKYYTYVETLLRHGEKWQSLELAGK